MKGICPGHVLHICFVYKLQWKRTLTMDILGTKHKWKFNITDRHDLKMSRNGTCDAKRHGNASAGTMVRLKLVFTARMCLQAILDLFYMSSRLNIQKKTKRRLVTNEIKTRFERGTKRGQKLPGTDPYPNPGAGKFSASANSCTTYNSNLHCRNRM